MGGSACPAATSAASTAVRSELGSDSAAGVSMGVASCAFALAMGVSVASRAFDEHRAPDPGAGAAHPAHGPLICHLRHHVDAGAACYVRRRPPATGPAGVVSVHG